MRPAGDLYIYDLDSVHGTFLNRIRIQPASYVPIHNGDFITFGASRRQYFVDGGPTRTATHASSEAASTSTAGVGGSAAAAAAATGGAASSGAAGASEDANKAASLSGPIGEDGREIFSGNALGTTDA